MKMTLGAMGWLAMTSAMAGLGACDDAKETCEKMCEKMGECLADPSAKGPAGEAKSGEQENVVSACKAECAGDGEMSDAEKEKMSKAEACLAMDCAAFVACIDKI